METRNDCIMLPVGVPIEMALRDIKRTQHKKVSGFERAVRRLGRERLVGYGWEGDQFVALWSKPLREPSSFLGAIPTRNRWL